MEAMKQNKNEKTSMSKQTIPSTSVIEQTTKKQQESDKEEMP